MLKEQKRSSKHISPNSLQNPTDPDATYRKKGKKKHIGYTANIVEKFNDKNRMIEGYDLQKNTYSDQKFAEDANRPPRLYRRGSHFNRLSSVPTCRELALIPTLTDGEFPLN